jgi:hypothetical protein
MPPAPLTSQSWKEEKMRPSNKRNLRHSAMSRLSSDRPPLNTRVEVDPTMAPEASAV